MASTVEFASVAAESLLRGLPGRVQRGTDNRPGVTGVTRGTHGVAELLLCRSKRCARFDDSAEVHRVTRRRRGGIELVETGLVIMGSCCHVSPHLK
jgi:hypothetical protein